MIGRCLDSCVLIERFKDVEAKRLELMEIFINQSGAK